MTTDPGVHEIDTTANVFESDWHRSFLTHNDCESVMGYQSVGIECEVLVEASYVAVEAPIRPEYRL